MKKTEVIKILAQVKSFWFNQPTDDLTNEGWCQALESVNYEAAAQAVSEVMKLGGPEPPAPGQIYSAAVEIDYRNRQRQRKLEAPQMPADERQRNIKFLHDIAAAIGDRAKVLKVYADFKGISTVTDEEEIFGVRR
ncbi:MAG: hypothetical protein ACLQU2_01210 [Candidatus Binataceae bacterium]